MDHYLFVLEKRRNKPIIVFAGRTNNVDLFSHRLDVLFAMFVVGKGFLATTMGIIPGIAGTTCLFLLRLGGFVSDPKRAAIQNKHVVGIAIVVAEISPDDSARRCFERHVGLLENKYVALDPVFRTNFSSLVECSGSVLSLDRIM